MTLRTYFLGWTMNMRLSAKSIQVMVTDDYSYTPLGYLIFIVQLEKIWHNLYVNSEMVPCQMLAIGLFSQSTTCQHIEAFQNEHCLWL